MRLIGILRLLPILLSSGVAFSSAATTSQSYGALYTDKFRNGTPGMCIAQGSTDTQAYMLQIDPVTGGLLVDLVAGSLTLGYDTDYGTVGANTLRSAAQIGNATGAASFGSGATSAQTLRVVLSTDTPGPSAGGKSYVDSARNDYSSVNVTTSAYVQLIAATAAAVSQMTLFDSSGRTLYLAFGGSGSESNKLIIPPGGIDGTLPFTIPAGTRVSLKAISATANAGEIDVTLFN